MESFLSQRRQGEPAFYLFNIAVRRSTRATSGIVFRKPFLMAFNNFGGVECFRKGGEKPVQPKSLCVYIRGQARQSVIHCYSFPITFCHKRSSFQTTQVPFNRCCLSVYRNCSLITGSLNIRQNPITHTHTHSCDDTRSNSILYLA